MSELSSLQKQQIADMLANRRAELCAEIRNELQRSGHEHFADLAGEVADAGDASVADMLVDHEIAIIRRQVDELAQVERAQQLVSGTEFGECQECGVEIGFQRLMAAPHATRCIACQTQHEKTYAHESTPRL
jgi:DnaK suppressor protein